MTGSGRGLQIIEGVWSISSVGSEKGKGMGGSVK